MKNIAIQVSEKVSGKEAVKYLESLGGKNMYDYACPYVFKGYFYINDISNVITYGYSTPPPDHITTIYTEIPEYPKLMLVGESPSTMDLKRVVFMEKNGRYLAWDAAETFKGIEKITWVTAWGYAKDIEEEQEIKEITLQEVADKFNISVENLRIKD